MSTETDPVTTDATTDAPADEGKPSKAELALAGYEMLAGMMLLGSRIIDGDPIVATTDEDNQRIYDGMKATIATLRAEHTAIEARLAVALVLLKKARTELQSEIGDPRARAQAVTDINEGLASIGVAL